MHAIIKMSANTNLPITFIGTEKTITSLSQYNNKIKPNAAIDYKIIDIDAEKMSFIKKLQPTSLLMVVFAHTKSISYDSYGINIIRVLQRIENNFNFLVIIPEQFSTDK